MFHPHTILEYLNEECLTHSLSEIEGQGGLYLDNSRPGGVAPFAADPANQQRMWDACNAILGIRQFGVDDGELRFK